MKDNDKLLVLGLGAVGVTLYLLKKSPSVSAASIPARVVAGGSRGIQQQPTSAVQQGASILSTIGNALKLLTGPKTSAGATGSGSGASGSGLPGFNVGPTTVNQGGGSGRIWSDPIDVNNWDNVFAGDCGKGINTACQLQNWQDSGITDPCLDYKCAPVPFDFYDTPQCFEACRYPGLADDPWSNFSFNDVGLADFPQSFDDPSSYVDLYGDYDDLNYSDWGSL